MTTWTLRAVNWIHGSFVSDRRADVLVDALAPLLVGHEHVLDVGCGDARLATRLRRRLPHLSIVGTDVMPGLPGIPRIVSDGRRLPFADASFDATLLVDVLHHADDPAATLREAARVSRRSIVIKDHLRTGRWSQAVLAFMDWFGNRPHGVALGYRFFAQDEWDHLFTTLGLGVRHWHVGIDLYPSMFRVVFRPGWHFTAALERTGDRALAKGRAC